MTWNYRIIRDGEGNLGLHEVFYDDDGAPRSCTQNPISFGADAEEGKDGIITALEHALSDAREKPILDMDDFQNGFTKIEAIPLLILSGPVGVGKTSTSEEVSNILVQKDISHTLIDLDVLAETYPRAMNDKFGCSLALKNLAAIWKNYCESRSKNIVLARVIETNEDKNRIAASVPNSKVIVCQLHADDQSLIRRVKKREIGSGYEWHKNHSLELARSLRKNAPCDFEVNTSHRSIVDIAEEIVMRVRWAE